MRIVSFKIIKDYILGKSSPEQLTRLNDWMDQSWENEKLVFELERSYHEGRGDYRPSADEVSMAETELMGKIMKMEMEEEAPRPKIYRLHRLRYAAAALIMLAVGAVVLWTTKNSGQDMVTVTAQSTKQVTLPDGSKVWLNKNSTINYPKNFEGSTRKVQLDGEALFEVVKNPDKPFEVSSQNVSARVLGTVFDFNTHGSGNVEEVTLLEGRLEVAENSGNGKVVIRPNQKVVLDKSSRTLEVKEVYAPIAAVWHDGMIPFAKMTVDQIAHTLEQLYHVDIVVDGSVDDNETYSGDIPYRQDINSVLRDLMNAIPIKYSRQGTKIIVTAKDR